MDLSFLVVLWIVFVVAQGIFQKKNSPKNLPPQENSPDFEIPTLANDPNFPGEETSVFVSEKTPSAEVREINLAELYRQKKFSAQTENKFVEQKILEESKKKNFSLELTPSAAMNAIVWSEILSKPKAKR